MNNTITHTLFRGEDRMEFDIGSHGGVNDVYTFLTYRANQGNTDVKLVVCPDGLSSSMHFRHDRTIEVEIGIAREIWKALIRTGWGSRPAS
jgi:hypothetical protein